MANTRMAGSTSPTDSQQRCPAPPTSCWAYSDRLRTVGAGMTTPGRLACVVPFCRRTTARAYFDEWICGDHWRLIDKVRRQVYGRHLRRWLRYGAAAYGPAAARIWRRMVTQ